MDWLVLCLIVWLPINRAANPNAFDRLEQAGMADPLKDCAPYVRLLRAVAPARLLLRRPDVHATLPPAIEAFLSSSSSSLAVTGTL